MSYLCTAEPGNTFLQILLIFYLFNISYHLCFANTLSTSTNHSSFKLLPPSLDSLHETELVLFTCLLNVLDSHEYIFIEQSQYLFVLLREPHVKVR